MFYLTIAGARPLGALISSAINVDASSVPSLEIFAAPLFSVGVYSILFGSAIWGSAKIVRFYQSKYVLPQE